MPMTFERWNEIGALYERALSRPPGERAALLDAACGHDPALRAEVETMLAAYEDDPDFLETPALPDDAGRPPLPGLDAEDPAIGSVGPYRLVRPLGRGGMGEVFLAVREVGAARQAVALKLLRPGLEDAAILRRFAAEQEILAQLDHPRIARMLDAGQAEDGRPFLVMEYVAGEPITAYCDRHRLPVDARLRLFVQVCEAVQFAHQHLVVHRDLKPSNILAAEPAAGGDGQVKLLDFGIAKVLDPVGEAALLTQTGQQMLTPAYASPEQLAGAPAATTSDVYGLGVLLYELLTGRRPHDAGSHPASEKTGHMSEHHAERPSTVVTESAETDTAAGARRTSPERLQRRLRGDLDTIVLMALRADPNRRYGSAAALAEDIQRHLGGLTVRARPDTLGYRVGKFVGRHWAGVTAAAAFVALLLGFGVAMAWQQAETARERDRAEAALVTSETTTGFVMDLFEASAPEESRGDTLSARDLLERGTVRLAALDDQPDVQSALRLLIGRVYRQLGDLGAAGPLIETALAERRARLGAHEDVAAALTALARTRTDEARFGEADTLALEALQMRQALFGAAHPSTAENLTQLATLHKHQGRYDEAARRFREVLPIQRAALDADDPRLGETLFNYARLLDARTEYEEAVPLFREAFALYRRTDGADAPSTLIAMSGLGLVLARIGEHDEGIALLEEAAVLRRRVLGPDHPGVGTTLTSLSLALSIAGRDAAALPHLEKAEQIYRAAYGDRHPNVAATAYSRGRMLDHLGRQREAEAAFRDALSIRRAAYGEDHPRSALTEMSLGRMLQQGGRSAEAEALYVRALATMRAKLEPDHAWTRDTEAWLAEVRQETAGR